jgi:hypothetical protein
MEVSLRLADISGVFSNPEKYMDAKIGFRGPAPDLSSRELVLTSDLDLTFDPTSPIACKRLTIRGCHVSIAGLVLHGMLSVDSARVSLTDCAFQRPSEWANYLLSADRSSDVRVSRTVFEDTAHSGLSADSCSTLSLIDCVFRRIGALPTALSGSSTLDASGCSYEDNAADCVTLDGGCSAALRNCTFLRCRGRAVDCGESCRLSMFECRISRCALGVLYGWYCASVDVARTTISDCDYSAIFLDHCAARIDRTRIFRCDGNGVNCSHSRTVIVSRCHFEETTYPPICICEESRSLVKRCEIVNSAMSGVVVRTGSTAKIEHSVIANSRHFGVVISDVSRLRADQLIILGSQVASVCCYNHARASIASAYLIGPTPVGMNIFTGGRVEGHDVSAIGMTAHVVWAHRGGSCDVNQVFVSMDPVDAGGDFKETVVRVGQTKFVAQKEVAQDYLVRNESCRPLHVGVMSNGNSFWANTDVGLAQSGQTASLPTCKECSGVICDCLFVPCAHALDCRRCWDALEVKPCECELCLIKIEGVCIPMYCGSDDGEKVCAICYAKESDSFIVPCGHAICHECGAHWLTTNSSCPFCRTPNAHVRWKVSYE